MELIDEYANGVLKFFAINFCDFHNGLSGIESLDGNFSLKALLKKWPKEIIEKLFIEPRFINLTTVQSWDMSSIEFSRER